MLLFQKLTLMMIFLLFRMRHNDEWSKPVIIRQDYLLDHFNNNVGSEAKGNITFYFSYTNEKVECSGQDFTKYVKDFTDFPQIEH